jgi:redox-sensitive bicupin YhaK (pirin superfamily)
MGPFDFPAGGGMDVPPHPHIDLATVTYLFEGAILHRDTLGNRQLIEPGAINLMTAGKGIAHSERSPDDLRNAGHRVHGLQLWHALPAETEGCEPAFDHYPEEDIPSVRTHGVEIRVLMGTAYGRISPVKDLAGALYLEYRMDGESSMIIPALADERAMYLIDGFKANHPRPIREDPRLINSINSGFIFIIFLPWILLLYYLLFVL